MAVDWGSKFKPSQRFVLISLVIELWMLTIYSATVLGLAIFLYSKQLIDLMVAAGVLFSLMGAIFSLIYVLLHCMLSRRFHSAGLRRLAKTRLDSACSNIPRLLMLLWLVATAADLLVTARRPACFANPADDDLWEASINCCIYRAIATLSILALISTCSIFCVNELSSNSFHASLTGYHNTALRDSVQVTRDPLKSISSTSSKISSSSFDIAQNPYPVYDLESSIASYSTWLQRRDSISSQLAVYPPTVLAPHPYTSTRSLGAMHVLDEDAPIRATTRFNSNPSLATSLLAPSAYSQPSRLPSIASANPWRLPLSTVHQSSHLEISIDALSKTLDPSSPVWERRTVRHVPLSQDPAIRKLSEGSESSDDDKTSLIGPTRNPLPKTKRRSVRKKLFPDVSVSVRAPASNGPLYSIPSDDSLQSERNFSVQRPPAAALWSHTRGRRHWTHRSASAYSVGRRIYGSGNSQGAQGGQGWYGGTHSQSGNWSTSGSSWHADTIHE